MKRVVIFECLVSFLMSVMLFVGCANPDVGEGTKGGELYEKDDYTVMGVVSCDDKGVAGVAVSDGTNVTKTDAYGRYWLPSNIAHREFNFIYI